MMKKLLASMYMAVLAVPSHAALELILESDDGQIFLDGSTGDYVIRYLGDEQVTNEVRWIPGNKIKPEVDVNLTVADSDEMVTYRYKLTNQQDAKQSIDFLALEVPEQAITELQGPAEWTKDQLPALTTDPATNQLKISATRIAWSASCSDSTCIGPGQSQSGYHYKALGIPGLGLMFLEGNAPMPSFPDHGPGGEIREFVDELLYANGISRYVAAPVIKPEGQQAEDILDAIADHIVNLSENGVIPEDMATRISSELRTAADALASGDIALASRVLGQLRGFIASSAATQKSNSNLLLLREVLIFDLNLVQSRYMRR